MNGDGGVEIQFELVRWTFLPDGFFAGTVGEGDGGFGAHYFVELCLCFIVGKTSCMCGCVWVVSEGDGGYKEVVVFIHIVTQRRDYCSC